MTREVKARIFEPFFTTKSRASHRGRGMGLAVVYAAVRNAGGFIRVDSEPGRGTTFRVHLPICESLSAAAEAQGSAGGDGVILVLQPDIVLQGVMAEALRQRGYTTITASDEQEAKWLCEAHPDVRLMVADAAHGDTAWTRVLGEGPRGGEGLCAILVGGDPQEWASSSWGRQVVGRIEKPFEIETLLAAVDQAWRPLAAPDA
jgi:CheY-like chemotaxis protein